MEIKPLSDGTGVIIIASMKELAVLYTACGQSIEMDKKMFAEVPPPEALEYDDYADTAWKIFEAVEDALE